MGQPYVPSTADWPAAGVHLTTETTFPEGPDASLKLTLNEPKSFTLTLRRPSWAGAGFTVKINGRAVAEIVRPRLLH